MPSTYNGIGTHYYGQKNVKTRLGICRGCHCEVGLKSYDTRLYFVVLFIPVFPLGRKRIVDQCPNCTWHYAMDARQWEVIGQLNASDALTQFANEPSSETAVRCHGQLLSFLQYEEARTLRDQALAQFPHDGVLRADLAWQLKATGQYADAQPLFDEALAIRPDLPAARAGKSEFLMAQGRLDEARDLLDFLVQPGAAQLYDLGPLLTLFEQLQKARRSEEALALVPHILQELPAIKDDFAFRKIVRQAEKAAGSADSLLPQPQRSWYNLLFSNSRDYSPAQRNWARAGVLAVVVLAALALHNESIRRQRTVHVVNHTGVPAQVRIGDAPPVDVGARAAISVGEGTHSIRITGPVESTETLVVSSGYFDRWFRRPVWVVNVNGEAILVESRIIYSAQPKPSQPTFHLGATTVALSDVDYLFDEEPPEKISVKGNHDVVKTQFLVLDYPVEAAVGALASQNLAGAMSLAERKLERQTDNKLLEAYTGVAERNQQQDRAAKFLEAQLVRRPIDIDWHRAYQALRDTPAHAPQLLERYEQLALSEPTSAAAWYLFSRVDPDGTRRDRSLEKALECDSKFAWALYAGASRACSRGDWQQAEQGYTAAVNEQPGDDAFRMAKIYSLLIQQKYDAVDEECAGWKTETPGALALVRCWTKHRQNLPVNVAALAQEAMFSDSHPSKVQFQLVLLAHLYYAVGNWDDLRAQLRDPQLQSIAPPQKAFYLLSLFSIDELKSELGNPALVTEGIDALAVSLAYSLAGEQATSADWRKAAIERLQQGNQADRETAAVLSGPAAPAISDFRNTTIGIQNRALVCAAIARLFPAHREQYLAEGQVWQFFPFQHYWLAERALHEP